MSEYILEMHDIVKYFPGVKALNGVQLKLRAGSVHALMGENGAGKSTLMNCLIGIVQKTSGTIIYKGKEVNFLDTNSALKSGISMIHQELSPIPERTVMQNVWVGREPKKGIFIDVKKMRSDTQELFKRLKIEVSPDSKMASLSVSQMQLIEIAKAVSYSSSIVIMDEPTSALTQSEAEQLFDIIDQLKKDNVAVVYISHKMDEIFRICDDVTVFRDGEYILTDKISNMNTEQLIKSMVGRELGSMFPKVDVPIGETVLKVEGLSSGSTFSDVSFELRKGEILGFAGLVGAGRTEVVETIFGIRKKTAGKIYKNNKEITVNSPIDAIKQGMAMLTEDRRKSGIVGVLSVSSNITLANLKVYGELQDKKKMRADTEEYIDKLSIKTPSEDFLAQNLSGGNQQKLLVARWLLTDPDILFVDEPTRGIDVGAKAEIHSLLSSLAGQGKAIIMISSEMPEVLGMADRILVMHEGRKTGIINREDATQELVMEYATSEAVMERRN